MKNSIFKLSLFLLLSIGLFSCETEPLDSGIEGILPSEEQILFAVDFNNNNYSTNNAVATIEAGILTVKAVDNGGEFVLQSNGVMVGTYTNFQLDFTYTDLETSNTYYSVDPINGVSNSELTITSIDFQSKHITGTFRFTGYRLTGSTENPTTETREFSQGIFKNIPYGDGTVIIDPSDPEEPSSEDYFPMAIGNTWIYDVTNEEEAGQIIINSTETINGSLYYKVNELPISVGSDIPEGEFPGLDVRAHLRKNGTNYIQRFYAFIPEMMGGMIPQTEIEPFEVTFLKDNLDEGQSWTETISIVTHVEVFGMSQTLTATATFNSIIEQKGISLTVNGVTYEDVIKVRTTATVVSEEGTEVSEGQNWFAKDIGLIKSYSDDPEEGISEMNLIEYILN